MKVISFLNQKGGVGKTTLSVNISTALANLAKNTGSVLLIDADPQGSALDWSGAGGERDSRVSVMGYPKSNLHQKINDFGKGRDYVVIDGAPRVTDLARSCIIASDLVLIPVQPSPYDIWASNEIVKLIEEAKIYKPSLKAAFVINRKIPNTSIGRDVRDALENFNLPVLSASITQRVVFAESAAAGMSVMDTDAKSNASHEINRLTKEILKLLNGGE